MRPQVRDGSGRAGHVLPAEPLRRLPLGPTPSPTAGAPRSSARRGTASGLDRQHAGDGDAWLGWWPAGTGSGTRCWTRFHAVPAGAPRCTPAAPLGVAGTLDFARLAVTSGAPVGQERVRRPGRRAAAHRQRDAQRRVAPTPRAAALFGWLLCMLGQDVGFPVPEGGAGELARRPASPCREPGVRVAAGVSGDRGDHLGRPRHRCPARRRHRHARPPRRARRRAGHRRSTATCWPTTRCRRGCGATSAGSSGTTRP